MAGEIPTVGEADFDGVLGGDSLPVLVEFTAAWCAPCQELAPELERFAQDKRGRVRVVAVDVDASPMLSQRYGVSAMPTLILFEQGVPAVRFADAGLGAVSRVLDAMVGGSGEAEVWQAPARWSTPRAERRLVFSRPVPGLLIIARRDGSASQGESTVVVPAGHEVRLMIGAEDLDALAALGSDDLDELTVRSGPVADEDLVRLLRLTGLTSLSFDELSVDGARQLVALENLRTLSLPDPAAPGSEITSESLAALRAAMPQTVVNDEWFRPDLQYLATLSERVPDDLPEGAPEPFTAALTARRRDHETATAYVTLVINPHHHAYAPGTSTGLPITLNPASGSPWKAAGDAVFPQTPDQTLSGTVLIALDLTGTADHLDLDLRIQLCHEDTCMPPTTTRLTTTLT